MKQKLLFVIHDNLTMYLFKQLGFLHQLLFSPFLENKRIFFHTYLLLY